MSLTSYRAAPPRAKVCEFGRAKPQAVRVWPSQTPSCGPSKQALKAKKRSGPTRTAALVFTRHRGVMVQAGKEAFFVVLGRSGNDLLSRVLRHSTIGAEAFNGRVRDGIGFFSPRSNHRTGEGQLAGKRSRAPTLSFAASGTKRQSFSTIMITDMDHESNQANRAISTSQLNASPRLHIWPINVVVFHGSDREHSFRGGFPA